MIRATTPADLAPSTYKITFTFDYMYKSTAKEVLTIIDVNNIKFTSITPPVVTKGHNATLVLSGTGG